MRQLEEASRALGIVMQRHRIRGPEDIDVAFADLAKEQADALITQSASGRLSRSRLASNNFNFANPTGLISTRQYWLETTFSQNSKPRPAIFRELRCRSIIGWSGQKNPR